MDFKLQFRKNHLFVEIGQGLWVYDTGCPTSFGDKRVETLLIQKIREQINIGNQDVDAVTISNFTGVTVAGLIGTDNLNIYDHLIDLRTGGMKLTIGDQLLPPATATGIDLGLLDGGIPYVQATICGQAGRYIFDTGAQLSYRVGDKPDDATPCTTTEDFWIPIGEFQTQTYHASVKLSGFEANLRFGVPPPQLAEFLKQRNIQGILGNELLIGRLSGYFPRSGKLYL